MLQTVILQDLQWEMQRKLLIVVITSCAAADLPAGHQGPPTHVSSEMGQGLSYSKARTGPMSRKQCCCSVFEWLFLFWVFFFFSLRINQSCQRALTLYRQTIFHNSLLLLNLLGKCPTVLMASHSPRSGEIMKPSAGMSARKARLRHAGKLTLPGQPPQGGPCAQMWHRGCGEAPPGLPSTDTTTNFQLKSLLPNSVVQLHFLLKQRLSRFLLVHPVNWMWL